MNRRVIFAVVACAAGLFAARAGASNINGSGGDMPAYYDAQLFTINFKELSETSSAAIHNNPSGAFNIIYQCDACAGQINGGDFVSVIDAIQGDGFNPIWEEWQITFINGNTPIQFFSDDEVLTAYANGVIDLQDTDEMYRCSVVGPKK